MPQVPVNPKISIVTPSFNQGQFLEQTIVSVLEQQYPHLEYIIIDGGSTDNSVDIIKKYEKHLHYWVSEPDGGQSEAINKGLLHCTGEIFNWLCSDDYYEPSALKTVAGAFTTSGARVVSGKFKILDSPLHPPESVLAGMIADSSLPKTIARIKMTQPATFFRLSDIRLLGGISQELDYFMDLELMIRYLIYFGQADIEQIDETLVNYRVHADSKTFRELDPSGIREDSAFTIEKNCIFQALARAVGHKKHATLLAALTKPFRKTYIPALEIKDASLVESSIEYYLYDFMKNCFYAGEYRKAALIAHGIDPGLLEPEEQKGLKYLERELILKKIKKYFLRK